MNRPTTTDPTVAHQDAADSVAAVENAGARQPREELTGELFARLACEQPTLTFLAAYDSQGIELTDPRWVRWMVTTAGPTSTVLVIELARQFETTEEWHVSPKLLAALLGVGRSRLSVAIARAIRYRYLFPHPTGALALDLRPQPPRDPMPWQ